jgi:heme oxygenase
VESNGFSSADRNLVRCFLQDDKVIAVVLQNNNLIGELPQEILKLVHLQELDLHKKSINWYNFPSIGKLKELKVLNLSSID